MTECGLNANGGASSKKGRVAKSQEAILHQSSKIHDGPARTQQHGKTRQVQRLVPTELINHQKWNA